MSQDESARHAAEHVLQTRWCICVQVARQLQRYLDGELDERGWSCVAGHLEVCPRCGLDAEVYREIKAALSARRADMPDEPLERLRVFAAHIADGVGPDEYACTATVDAAPRPSDNTLRALTWKRRLRTIPAMLGTTAAALVLAPFIIVGAIAGDAIDLRRRCPTLRMYLFVCQYLINDSAEILAAGPLWIVSGCGQWSQRLSSRRRYQRIQVWSISVLARRGGAVARRPSRRATRRRSTQSLRHRPSSSVAMSACSTRPCRHCCVSAWGCYSSGIIMAEALTDPGFDLLYQHRDPRSSRRDAPAARDQIAAFARNIDPHTIPVIFPEGRLFRPEILQRSLERLAERDPDGATSRRPPTRPAAPARRTDHSARCEPDADVVVVNHAGLDRYPTLAELAREGPTRSADSR